MPGVQNRAACAVLDSRRAAGAKLETFTEKHRAAQARVRSLIWNFYASLKIIGSTRAGAVAWFARPL